MRGILDLFKRFRADERGVFAVVFGLLAIVLVAMAGAAVDYTGMETARAKAQIALDSAALGLAPKIYAQTEEQLRKSAEDLVRERLNDSTLTVSVDSADATTATGTLKLEGKITVPMAFVQLIGIPTMTTKLTSEATRGSVNLEVAVALDTTGSMGSSGIATLQTALSTLIPLVVKDQQVPTYSKMALVPYSTAVNVGADYALGARGPVVPPKTITAVDWKNGVVRNIKSISKTNPAVVTTTANHGYITGEFVYIAGVGGMTQVNSKKYRVVVLTNTTFSLQTVVGVGVSATGYSTASNNTGTSQRCYLATCDIVVTTTDDHELVTGQTAMFTGVNGMTQLNFDFTTKTSSLTYNKPWFVVTKLTNKMFALDGTDGTDSSKGGGYGAYTSGGLSYCVLYGCTYYRYRTDRPPYKATASCVTERMTNSFNDVAPSNTLLSINYTSDGVCGITEKMLPLTSDKSELQKYTASGALKWSGNTAGQIGTAWAWYLVAPAFGELFATPSKPATYEAPNTLKIVIIMTDGAYNQEYCRGVVAGNTSTSATCSAPDGTTGTMTGPFGQAEDLCYNMKQKGVVVYTVGFNLGTSGNEVDLLKKCASDSGKAKLANDNAGLVKAFREIGENISDLRLSQ